MNNTTRLCNYYENLNIFVLECKHSSKETICAVHTVHLECVASSINKQGPCWFKMYFFYY